MLFKRFIKVATILPMALTLANAAGSQTFEKTLVSNSQVDVGSIVEYKLKGSCSSSTDGCGVLTITDNMPDGLEIDSCSVPNDEFVVVKCEVGGTEVEIKKEAYNGGDSFDIRIKARVKLDAPTQTPITNSATAHISAANEDSDEDVTSQSGSITVNKPTPKYEVQKHRIDPASGIKPTVDSPTTYSVKLCALTAIGNTNLQNVVLQDTFQDKATVKDKGDATLDNNTLTWNIGDIDLATLYDGKSYNSKQCIEKQYTLIYKKKDGGTFDINDTIENTFEVTANDPDGNGVDGLSVTLNEKLGPPESIPQLSKSANDVTPGEDIIWYLNANLNLANTVTEDFVIYDKLPKSPSDLIPSSVYAGSWNSPETIDGNSSVQAEIFVSSDDVDNCKDASSWTSLSNGFIESSNTNKSYDLPSDATCIKWVFEDKSNLDTAPAIPKGWRFTDSPRVKIKTSTAKGEVTNCIGGTYTDYYGDTQEANEYCSTINIEDPTPEMRVYKSVNKTNNVKPNDLLQFTITIKQNTQSSTGDTVNPVIADLMPQELEFVSLDNVYLPDGKKEPNLEVIENFEGNKTLLKFSWNDESFSEDQKIVIKYSARVKPGTVEGEYSNKIHYYDNSGRFTCDGTATNDEGDLDGDGNSDEQVCKRTASFEVISAAVLVGNKWIKADNELLPEFINTLDVSKNSECPVLEYNSSRYTRYPCVAQASQRGTFKYLLKVTNAGNVNLTNYILYDVLPKIGDYGVDEALKDDKRGTEWEPQLAGAIEILSAPNNANIEVEYSMSNNPCRPELSKSDNEDGWQDDCEDNWTTQVDDYSKVKAFRLRAFVGNNWAPLENVYINVPMKLPNDRVKGSDLNNTNDLHPAWNSFAHRVSYDDGDSRLPTAEPRKVGIVLKREYCLGDYVWEDKNGNGIQDSDESGIPNVEVKLFDGNTEINSTRTNSDGLYEFCKVEADKDYTIKFITPSGYSSTVANAEDNDSIDSDAVNGEAPAKVASSSEFNTTIDAGFVKPVCIGDYVWEDTNANGIQDNNESGIGQVVVKLIKNGEVIQEKNTTNDGNYTFCNVTPGDYTIEFTPPSGYYVSPKNQGDNDIKDSDIDSSNNSVDITVTSGENNMTYDAGFYRLACISNLVWEDANANGIQNDNEDSIAGVHVELYDVNGKVDEMDTNSTGEYKFCVKPGDYHIKVTPPDGYVVTPKDQGGDDAIDSDINATTRKSDDTNLESGENDSTWDAGLYKPACLGDYTWLDKNVNGLQDTNEDVLEGVEVTLLDSNDNVVDKNNGGANNSAIEGGNPQITNSEGKYHFCNLKPGTYKVKFTKAHDENGAPYISTKVNNSNNEQNSDVDEFIDAKDGLISSEVTLKSGDDNTTLDAGFIQELCLGDKVWEDTNANGIQEDNEEPIANVNVSLFMKNDSGNWIPATDVQGNSVETNTTTNNGNYKFCHLQPAKDYKIVFEKPQGYYVSYKDIGDDDTKDSDIDDKSEIVVLSPTKDNMNLDAGFFKPACLGNFVWEDINANGIQENGENGINGAKVELFYSNGGSVVDVNGSMVEAKETNTTGGYKFCSLRPNSYKIKVTPPEGEVYYVTYKNKDSNDTKDSDIDPTSKESDNVVLSSGDNNTTVDAGLFKPACIGDYIWDDKNANGIQDENEIGVEGVTVELVYANGDSVVDVNGNAVEPQETNTTGGYKFCNLRPNSYKIKSTMPEGYYTTKANVENNNSNDAIDSDFEPVYNPTQGETKEEILISGENNITLDGGIFQTACVGSAVWLDKNGNGIQEEGEPGIANVTITLLKEDGDSNITNVKGEQIEEFVTSEDGKYQFCDLLPGTYRIKFEAKPENGAPYISTGSDKGDENDDSDIPEYILNGGVTEPITLKGGDSYQAVKAGFINEICLGGNMWYDENLNGILDEDKSVMDVAVYLYEKDGKTIAKDIYGNPVKAIKTDKDGKYKFCHIQPARDYVIKFDTPKGYLSTTKDRGSNDTIDSELLANSTIYVKHPVKDNLTLNSGIYCECDDYKVHPNNYKKESASVFNLFGAFATIFILGLVATRREK